MLKPVVISMAFTSASEVVLGVLLKQVSSSITHSSTLFPGEESYWFFFKVMEEYPTILTTL